MQETHSGIAASSVAEDTALTLDVYGLRIRVASEWVEILDELRRDFSWFASEASVADVSVEVHRDPPDLTRFGALEAAFVTPRNVVFQDRDRTVIDYVGQAVAVLQRSTGTLTVTGQNSHLVHEAVYLFLLSRIGEHLDAIGRPRLHALGLAGRQGGVAVMLPSGGGKSTLALRALRAEGVRLLSEDSPLLDRRGRIHPFPLRIGVNETDAPRLAGEHTRRIERMEFDPKLLLDIEAFADRIEARPQPLRHIVIGTRTLSELPVLEPIPSRRLAAPLMRECVVGVGLYQGMEFVLQRGMRDVAGKSRPAATRALCCAAAARGARAWSLRLGRDADANWSALAPLLG